jgi:hypothetical protein
MAVFAATQVDCWPQWLIVGHRQCTSMALFILSVPLGIVVVDNGPFVVAVIHHTSGRQLATTS